MCHDPDSLSLSPSLSLSQRTMTLLRRKWISHVSRTNILCKMTKRRVRSEKHASSRDHGLGSAQGCQILILATLRESPASFSRWTGWGTTTNYFTMKAKHHICVHWKTGITYVYIEKQASHMCTYVKQRTAFNRALVTKDTYHQVFWGVVCLVTPCGGLW